jgi:hypothetical protein
MNSLSRKECWTTLGLFGVFLALGGCLYGYDIKVNATRLSPKLYNVATDNVETYFGADKPNRPYESIAFLEVTGGSSSDSVEVLLTDMKERARILGAHAVISIEKQTMLRRQGSVAVDLISIFSDHHDNDANSVPTLTGVAVRYRKEDAKEPMALKTNEVVAVFDIQAIGGVFEPEALQQLSSYLTTRLVEVAGFQVTPSSITRAQLQESKNLSYRECFDAACQIELGKAVSAEKSLSVTLQQIENNCVLSLTLYDLKREAAERAASEKGLCNLQSMMTVVDQSVSKLASVLPKTQDVLKPAPAVASIPSESPSQSTQEKAAVSKSEVIEESITCPPEAKLIGKTPPKNYEQYCEISTLDGQKIRHGSFIGWYQAGRKASLGQYAYGKKDGPWTYWYENGQKKLDARYNKDVAIGRWITYRSDGSVEAEEEKTGL